MFQPGQSGNPAGRPKGAVNRKWASIGYWFEMIEENLETLSPADKIALAKWAMAILIDKTKQIDNPEESKQNVEQTLEMLKAMESKGSK